MHLTPSIRAALVFGMPAMSPTMTEGGVVLWKFKPGDLFNAGDVLLEVETDKATIDVEVTDDGILWKILEQDGATGIPVNQAIAYIAEPGDDLLSLQIPESKAVESTPTPTPAAPTQQKSSDAQQSEKPSSNSSSPSTPSSTTTAEIFHAANPNQKLFPSVEMLLHEHGISRDDAIAKISASGPNGRLLQGDVLAHLGSINKDSIEKVVSYVKSRQHLDLSSITLATPEELRRLQQIEDTATAAGETALVSLAHPPKVPNNIRNLSLVSVLEEPIANSDFLHGVRLAMSAATRDAYSLKFPQYASSPVDAGLAESSDSLFEQLTTPSVTQNRFELVSISCKQESMAAKASTNTNATENGDIFDELMGAPPKLAASPYLDQESCQGPVTMVVEATVRLNESAGDANELYAVFKNALQARYPVEHVNIIG